MFNLIQLTRRLPAEDDQPVWLNPAQIVSVQDYKENGFRINTNDETHYVTETPEQIQHKIREAYLGSSINDSDY